MSTNGSALDLETVSLVELAASIAKGDEPDLRERIQMAVRANVPHVWVDELLLQSALIAGWPRALTAAEFWRKAVGPNGSVRDHDLDYADWEKWKKRGEKSCRIVYGDNYQRLRESIRKLHPAFEAWMITEAYGRTLSRPKLDMKRRELCTVVQTAVLNTPRQLHAHLRGSLNAGASFEEVEAAIALINPFLPYDDWKGVRERWERVRDGWSPLE